MWRQHCHSFFFQGQSHLLFICSFVHLLTVNESECSLTEEPKHRLCHLGAKRQMSTNVYCHAGTIFLDLFGKFEELWLMRFKHCRGAALISQEPEQLLQCSMSSSSEETLFPISLRKTLWCPRSRKSLLTGGFIIFYGHEKETLLNWNLPVCSRCFVYRMEGRPWKTRSKDWR